MSWIKVTEVGTNVSVIRPAAFEESLRKHCKRVGGSRRSRSYQTRNWTLLKVSYF